MDDNERAELEELRELRARLDSLILGFDALLADWQWSPRPYERASFEDSRTLLLRVRDGDSVEL